MNFASKPLDKREAHFIRDFSLDEWILYID